MKCYYVALNELDKHFCPRMLVPIWVVLRVGIFTVVGRMRPEQEYIVEARRWTP